MFCVTDVIRWATNGITVVTASSIEAGLFTAANARSGAFVNVYNFIFYSITDCDVVEENEFTLTRPVVRGQSVAIGALATVTARLVDTDSDAQTASFFVQFAFIDIVTRSAISCQFVTGLTTALVRAPSVGASLLTQALSLGTFVDIFFNKKKNNFLIEISLL